MQYWAFGVQLVPPEEGGTGVGAVVGWTTGVEVGATVDIGVAVAVGLGVGDAVGFGVAVATYPQLGLFECE